jgi:RNA polymerase sigma-70 factor (ECF subfamily)
MPDAAEFEVFYRENLTRIVRACALVTLDRSVAEEVAAEAFARLWSRWGVIRSEDHAGGYVFKSAMRLCARQARRRPLPGMPPPSGDTPERALERHDVRQALSSLPVRQRQVVVLRDWAGFETAEVARLLGMRPSTVRVHLARAREHLRRILSPEEGRYEYRTARP